MPHQENHPENREKNSPENRLANRKEGGTPPLKQPLYRSEDSISIDPRQVFAPQ